ncbi:MAG: tetratricopeptide repeat protein [Thermodesulfobacteriota bacterium]
MTRQLGLFIFFMAAASCFSGCSGLDLVKADFKMSQEAYDEAIPILETYLQQHPDSIDEMNKLGFAYLKSGKLDQAVSTFEKTLVLKPGDPYAVLYLGTAYLNKGEFGKAGAVWQGYRDQKKPLVEEEIRRMITVLQIAESQKAAREALAAEASLKTAGQSPNTVAVCYYKDLSPDNRLRSLQKGLAAMVITDLSKIKSLKVVERVRLQALMQEMKLGQTGVVDQGSAPRVGKLLGAGTLVTGGMSEGIQISTSLASAIEGKVKGTTTATVPQEAFFDIPKQIVMDTAKMMDIRLTPEETRAIGTPHTTNFKALMYYGDALDAMDAGNWAKAKNLFAMALQEDPKFDMARDGYVSCPTASTPAVGQLAAMSAGDVATYVETAIQTAKDNQTKADKAAEAAAKEGRGGGGGGGGGH